MSLYHDSIYIVEQCQQAKLVWGKELCAIRSLETVC